jgi:5-bromo-4-chloroindolyl phosphate hydrolysis protein
MMDWQFWSFAGGIAFGFTTVVGAIIRGFTIVVKSVWQLRDWAEQQFKETRENAHLILDKHEAKDAERHRDNGEQHRENVERLNRLELEHAKSIADLKEETSERIRALEVQLARISRAGGERTGPGFVA